MDWIVSPSIHMLKSQLPVCQNIILFRDMVFKAVIKLKQLGWDCNPIWQASYIIK